MERGSQERATASIHHHKLGVSARQDGCIGFLEPLAFQPLVPALRRGEEACAAKLLGTLMAGAFLASFSCALSDQWPVIPSVHDDLTGRGFARQGWDVLSELTVVSKPVMDF